MSPDPKPRAASAPGAPATFPPPEPGAWRGILRDAIRDPDLLIEHLGLPDDLRAAARRSHALFPVVVPAPLLARITPGDPDDPILRQVLPALEESAPPSAEYSTDPVGEEGARRAPGLLHKYPGRALMIVAGVCAVSCRYCFRRHYPYDEAPAGLAEWEPTVRAIEEAEDLEEIIFSGGDPLMRGDRTLAALVARLEEIPHLRRLRIHTRLPIVIPERVDAALLGWLANTRLAPTVVVHANHPAEIDASCAAALLRLVRAGVPVLNQAVLLRGVNDEAAVLAELSRRLLDARVQPYYLHQLDPVAGAAHFEVSVEEGRALIEQLRRELPGFAVPRYVREVVGEMSKMPLI